MQPIMPVNTVAASRRSLWDKLDLDLRARLKNYFQKSKDWSLHRPVVCSEKQPFGLDPQFRAKKVLNAVVSAELQPDWSSIVLQFQGQCEEGAAAMLENGPLRYCSEEQRVVRESHSIPVGQFLDLKMLRE